VIREFGGYERRNVIVCFLAILEMARLKLVRVTQPADGNNIYVSPIMENLLAEDAIGEENSFDEDLRLAERGEGAA
jgi:chromatin segregation and condensation protein Rec8/ScpA/Scc1 (kleisin family)